MNDKDILAYIESERKQLISSTTATLAGYRKRLTEEAEAATFFKDEAGHLARAKAGLIADARQAIEAADKRFSNAVNTAAAKLKKELDTYRRKPVNPELLSQLRAYTDFGLTMSRSELDSFISAAEGNHTALKIIQKLAANSGFAVTLPGGLEKDIELLESLGRVPTMFCPADYVAKAKDVLADVPSFRDDGSIANTLGRPDTVYLLIQSGKYNSAADKLTAMSEKWERAFVPEISELKPIEDPATGEIISPEEQHAQAVEDAADAVDIKTAVSEMRSDKSGQSILDIYK